MGLDGLAQLAGIAREMVDIAVNLIELEGGIHGTVIARRIPAMNVFRLGRPSIGDCACRCITRNGRKNA